MKPIAPTALHAGAERIRYTAKATVDQQWNELHAAVDKNNLVLTEWELDAEDLARLWRGGTIRLWIRAGTHATIFPMSMQTVDPEPEP